MLELAQGLTERQLAAIAGLEARAVRHDGGRLKLEWGTLRRRPADEVNDLLWWEGETLTGFLGLYVFGTAAPELTGMVDPIWRRRGIGGSLLAQGLELWRSRSPKPVLLVVPRSSQGGHALAHRAGGVLDHSEHALVLDQPPAAGAATHAIEMTEATAEDLPRLSALMLDGFGSGEIDAERALDHSHTRTLMIRSGGDAIGVGVGGDPIGAISLALEGDRGGVYGFVIASERRGQGIGGQVLRTACRDLFAAGATRVGLEVAVENERALGLYTGLGFRALTTEDYYELEWPGVSRGRGGRTD